MQINEDWRITSDPLNVILQRRVTGETREGEPYETWEAAGYYPTLDWALQDLARKEIFGTGLQDLETVNKKIRSLEKLIRSLNTKEVF